MSLLQKIPVCKKENKNFECQWVLLLIIITLLFPLYISPEKLQLHNYSVTMPCHPIACWHNEHFQPNILCILFFRVLQIRATITIRDMHPIQGLAYMRVQQKHLTPGFPILGLKHICHCYCSLFRECPCFHNPFFAFPF